MTRKDRDQLQVVLGEDGRPQYVHLLPRTSLPYAIVLQMGLTSTALVVSALTSIGPYRSLALVSILRDSALTVG